MSQFQENFKFKTILSHWQLWTSNLSPKPPYNLFFVGITKKLLYDFEFIKFFLISPILHIFFSTFAIFKTFLTLTFFCIFIFFQFRDIS